MDLSTTYLGLELKNPLVMGASPLVDDLDTVRRAEDAGVGAVVMHSLFEEQLRQDEAALRSVQAYEVADAEAMTLLPRPNEFVLGPDAYFEQLRKVKEIVSVPVMGSLNGSTDFGWVEYAKAIQQAGADALELNIYSVASDPKLTSEEIEKRTLATVKAIADAVKIPVAVKLSPFYTSLANFAGRLQKAGAKGLVLFNRFYQPDIDIEALDVELKLELSTSSDLLLRLRWLALLSGRLEASLAVSGGVHTASDALKAVMAGANAVQIVSALIKNGPGQIAKIRAEMDLWLTQHEYTSLRQALGSMNLSRSPNPERYERAQYVKLLQTYSRTLLGS